MAPSSTPYIPPTKAPPSTSTPTAQCILSPRQRSYFSLYGYGYDATTSSTTRRVLTPVSEIQPYATSRFSSSDTATTVQSELDVKSTARYPRVLGVDVSNMFGSYQYMTARAQIAASSLLQHTELERLMYVDSAVGRVLTEDFTLALQQVTTSTAAEAFIVTWGTHVNLKLYLGVRSTAERRSTQCTSAGTAASNGQYLVGLVQQLESASSSSYYAEESRQSATSTLEGGPGDFDCLTEAGWAAFVGATTVNTTDILYADVMAISSLASGTTRTLLEAAAVQYIGARAFPKLNPPSCATNIYDGRNAANSFDCAMALVFGFALLMF